MGINDGHKAVVICRRIDRKRKNLKMAAFLAVNQRSTATRLLVVSWWNVEGSNAEIVLQTFSVEAALAVSCDRKGIEYLAA
jgi:hypothetical protein